MARIGLTHPAGEYVEDQYRYRYTGLQENEIRVLILPRTAPPASTEFRKFGEQPRKSRKTMPIYHFKVISLKNPSPYEALSYVWGDQENTARIRIGQNSMRKPITEIAIKPSLYEALNHLRLKDDDRYLWIDALCINQEDWNEKSSQLMKMAQIYQQATNVCIWLGLAQQSAKLMNQRKFNELLSLKIFNEMVTNDEQIREWEALRDIMRRPWFSRRWCIQEIALAREATVCIGKTVISWEDFANIVALYEKRSEDLFRIFAREHCFRGSSEVTYLNIGADVPGASTLVQMLNKLFRKDSNGQILQRLMPLEALMSTLSIYTVSQPRDMIYAVLSLAKDTYQMKAIQPNPEQGGHVTRLVYMNFIKHCIDKSKSLDIICVPWAHKLDVPLPSWITLATSRAFKQYEEGFSRINADTLAGTTDQISAYTAAGESYARNYSFVNMERFSSPPHLLKVHGREIGMIEHLEDQASNGDIPYSWLDLAIRVDNAKGHNKSSEVRRYNSPAKMKSKRAKKPAKKPVRIPDEFWRTLVANKGPDGKEAPPFYKLACKEMFRGYDMYCTRVTSDCNSGKIISRVSTNILIYDAVTDKKKTLNRETIQWLRGVQAATWNRRFLVTKFNSIGLAPAGAERGDRICLLWGCSVPVILRPYNGHYKLIGECYIEGIMDGQMFSDDPDHWKKWDNNQEYSLC